MVNDNMINIPGIMGMNPLSYELPSAIGARRVKVYLVPEALSSDRYFISITSVGATEVLPPCRGRDTTLILDFTQDQEGLVTLNFVHEEVQNA